MERIIRSNQKFKPFKSQILPGFTALLCIVSSFSCHPLRPGQSNTASDIVMVNKHSELKMDSLASEAKLVFDSSHYHFGQIRQGQLLFKEIHFTNLGKSDLSIDIISACECTTLDWSRLPIKPGARSTIKIKYDSKDKEGKQIVDIDVLANTEPPNTYTKFSLEVIK